MAECRGEPEHRIGEALEGEDGSPSIIRIVLELGEIEQQVNGKRGARRDRVVGDIARPGYQLFGIARCIEECADLVVPEPGDDLIADLPSKLHPLLFEAELVKDRKSVV